MTASENKIHKTNKKNKILVVGDIMLDIYSFGYVSRVSPEAPVPVLMGKPGDDKYVPGGAANVALNLLAAGVDGVSLFALAGQDRNGKLLLHILEEAGVDTGFVYKDSGRPTTVKHRYIAQHNQQILRVDNEELSPVGLEKLLNLVSRIEQKIGQYGLILISDYNKGLLSEELTQKIIRLAVKEHIPVLVDVKGMQSAKYKGATLLKPNRDEVQALTGEEVRTAEDAARASIQLCGMAECEYVLTTLGAEGMVLTDNNSLLLQVQSSAQEVYDVTGAGDTSIAYLAAELVKGSDICRAVKIANSAAGVQVSKIGTSIVHWQEVMGVAEEADERSHGKELDFYKEGGLENLNKAKKGGQRIVFTNGCFDILHTGHVEYLRKARALGDLLVVGVNGDGSVKRLKGNGRPVNSLADRVLLLSALEFVDYVIPFDEETPAGLIKAVMPDVLVKGGDYEVKDIVGAEDVMLHGGVVTTIPFVDGKSTSEIIKRIRK